MLPIKRVSANDEVAVLDTTKQTTKSKTISEAIAKMQEAIDKKDMKAFYHFRDEVESLFRLHGYAE